MTRCHTLRGHVSDHAHRICWMIKWIREKEVDGDFYTQHGPTYQGRGDLKPKIYKKTTMLYHCKSVKREYTSKILEVVNISQNTDKTQ